MANVPIKLVTRSYTHVMPLAAGDVVPEGIHLVLDRTTSISRFREDRAFQAGEHSFSQFLIRHSQGDRSIVALPIFVMRGFRQRCFFVRRDSPLQALADLAGKHVGTNGWPDTGNTWSRAALRTAGVDLTSIRWSVGPVDEPRDEAGRERASNGLPEYVRHIPAGQSLSSMLLSGELDAIMCPWPPTGFYTGDSQLRRLIPNYPAAERTYYEHVGFYPAHHIVGLRREVFEQHPWVAGSLFDAFEQARLKAQADNLLLADAAPWVQADIEAAMILMGDDFQPNGVEANKPMIAALCAEEYAQALVAQQIEPDSIFADFEQAYTQH